MKYIAPGGWFSLEYPAGWREFEDTEESFLFYDPDKWSGNFRISAYRGADTNYGKECVSYELKENPAAELTLIRGVQSAYSVDSFQEEGIWYTSQDRKSTRLNSSHRCISYAVFCWNVLLR